jgi:hypothetical protein
MKLLFISHAVKDKELVDALIELFEGGIGLTKEPNQQPMPKIRFFKVSRLLLTVTARL